MPQKYTIQRQKNEGPSRIAAHSYEIVISAHKFFCSPPSTFESAAEKKAILFALKSVNKNIT
jgi:hypothetical protein